ncbi:helix-turn-helix domain-containing protein [Adlercreutzia murintestinalis]|uniref:helix-turn-helix domain-containing protein n=1 Tax=Adlercreutzia murintestinalis TaxID=2941325 RepID=UPI0020402160|nr:helix-turn-helix domain-containing protein [Adlercreutzia murintestinalis]
MPRQDSYGRMLRDAREREGYDLTTMARRLHIRPDILRAIEESDFDRMPAQGYTRNMIRAYARAVGLDQNRISGMYQDAVHLHETGRSRAGSYDDAPRRARSSTAPRSERDRRRPSGTQRSSRSARERTTRSSRRSGGYGFVGESRATARAATPGGYPSIYSDPRGAGRSLPSLPVWIIIAVVLVAIIIVLIVLFNSNKQAVEDVPDIPISGFSDTSNPEGEGSTDVADQPPTSALLSFSVEAGGRSWVEITQDDKTVLSEVISGPYDEEFEVTGTLTVRTANPDPVKLAVDGVDVQLARQSGSEYYAYTVDFSQILRAWQDEHGDSSSSSASSASSQSSSSSSSAQSPSSSSSQESS